MIRLLLLFRTVLILCASVPGSARGPSSQEYVTAVLMGRFGNQLFQIAAAYAHALDHDLVLTVPHLQTNSSYNISYNAKRVFSAKIRSDPLPTPPARWSEPGFNYKPIPAVGNVELFGYFQSEKYFRHRREEIEALFAPPEEILDAVLKKYPFFQDGGFTVAVQVRDYRDECPTGAYHPTLTRSYYEKAISLFPEDTLFIVSSNNRERARECTEGLATRIIYLQGSDDIEEFYTLALCDSFIIGNSSFGWWAAWLSPKEGKRVIAPKRWFAPPYDNQSMTRDLFPPEWILLED